MGFLHWKEEVGGAGGCLSEKVSKLSLDNYFPGTIQGRRSQGLALGLMTFLTDIKIKIKIWGGKYVNFKKPKALKPVATQYQPSNAKGIFSK